MGDNKNERNSPDSKRINLSEKYEIDYWTKELGVSEEKLRKVVDSAGNSAEAVRKALNK